MKKALSVLLAAALLLCVAAPAALAAPSLGADPEVATITMGEELVLWPLVEEEDAIFDVLSDVNFLWTSSHSAVTITPDESEAGPPVITIADEFVTVVGGTAAKAYTATITCTEMRPPVEEPTEPAPPPEELWTASYTIRFVPVDISTPLVIAADKTALKVGIPFVAADATATFSVTTHACLGADLFLLFWDVTDNVYPVVFRPGNNTWGATGKLTVEAKSALTADISTTIYAECQDCGARSNQITLNIEVEENDEREEDSLLYILTKWWHDLKWTWDYQIHPFFKYIYFNTGTWISSAWNMLVDLIKGLFE